MKPSPPVVKICGLARLEDAREALSAGADWLGFIFFEGSKRFIEPARAASILAALRAEFPPERVRPVGVFVNASAKHVRDVADLLNLHAVQLHGDETPDDARALDGLRVVKAARVRSQESLDALEPFAGSVSAFLLDAWSPSARGGTGEAFDHSLAEEWVRRHPTIIAGGLDPGNVGEVVRRLRPMGVDVSSGVEESSGVKNHEAIRRFVANARAAFDQVCSP